MSYKITDKCIGCTICAKNCPVGAISGKLKDKHEIDPQICVDCGLCGKICPQAAILTPDEKIAEKVPKSEWKKPVVDRDSCAGCSICVVNCPVNCLKIEDPKYHGDIGTIAVLSDSEKCIGCGICQRVCPIDAIHL